MTVLDDALDNIQKVHDNESALADPTVAKWTAEMAFKSAVVAALNSLMGDAPVASAGTAQVAELTAKNVALEAQLVAEQAAVVKFAADLVPKSRAEPAMDIAQIAGAAGESALAAAAVTQASATDSADASQQTTPIATTAAPNGSAAPSIAPSNAGIA